MFKFELKEAVAVLLLLATLAVAVALTGTFKPEALSLWTRVAFAVLGVGLFIAILFLARKQKSVSAPEVSLSTNQEYEESFKKTQDELSTIIPEIKLLAECQIGGTMLQIVSDDIVGSKADIVVSSDDNYFTARGGVAKAILTKGGTEIAQQLSKFRRHKFRQGQLAVTTGGKSGWRAILHTAVIDLDESRYPTPDVIRLIVRRCLVCAEAIGAQRIAFPVLGGGTASKRMTPQESADAMLETIIASLQGKTDRDVFSYIAVYAFRSADADRAVERLNKLRVATQATQAAQT